MSAPRGNAASTVTAVHDAERHSRHSHGDRGNDQSGPVIGGKGLPPEDPFGLLGFVDVLH